MHPTLAFGGIMALLASLAYGTLGVLLWRRPIEPERRRPWVAYAAWWCLVSALLANSGLTLLAGAAGVVHPVPYLVQAHVERLLLALALWSLMAYLTYLQMGSTHLWPLLGAFYAFLWLQMTYRLVLSDPAGVALEPWARPRLVERGDAGWIATAVRLEVFVPPLAAALLHLRLLRFSSKDSKGRILAAAAGIIAWLTIPSLAYFHPHVLALQVVARSVTLGFALVLLWIYLPLLRDKGPATAPPGVKPG